MVPFEQMPLETLATTRAVLTDIDDTLTTDGRLTAAAYAALERLAEAGVAIDRIDHLRAYDARGRSGDGFTEVAERVLAARAGP